MTDNKTCSVDILSVSYDFKWCVWTFRCQWCWKNHFNENDMLTADPYKWKDIM